MLGGFKMTKQEREQKKLELERHRQGEIDAILQRSLKTRPPSDLDLQARLSQEPLASPTATLVAEVKEEGDSSLLPLDTAEHRAEPFFVPPKPHEGLPTPALRPPPELSQSEQEPIEES